MRSDKLNDAIGEIRDDFIIDSEVSGKNRAWVKWAAMAACLCLVVAGAFGISKQPEAVQTPQPVGEYKVYTPSFVPPELRPGVQPDMIGCLVYNGAVYTQSIAFEGNNAAAEAMIGEYVGEAKGNLNEWTDKEVWKENFASTYDGSVYTVKGYDKSFRLCIWQKWYDGTQSLQLLDNYDGIGLNTGKDLFEDRLHIRNNVAQIKYLTHYDWNCESHIDHYKQFDKLTDEQFESFIDELCGSEFVFIDYETMPDFYETPTQGHLYLEMKDGTTVELRLIDGGYVGCQQLGWYFVKMPGEPFDAVLSACQ